MAFGCRPHWPGGPTPFGLGPKGPKTQGNNEASAAQGKTPGPPFLPGQGSCIPSSIILAEVNV
ncbi:MAG TPA: hypothetical protein VGB63_09905 [Pedobacter sp.]|jgi:hypothetical protein